MLFGVIAFALLKDSLYTALNSIVLTVLAHEQIIDHIRERSIDLLVLGIRKSSHLNVEMRVSRAIQTIVDAECPVLTIQH